MNQKISGFINKHNFAKYLNNNKVKLLTPDYRLFLKNLYGPLENEDITHSKINYDKKKFDMEIEINGTKKLISIKKEWKILFT